MGFLSSTLEALVNRVPIAHGRAAKEVAQIVAPPLEQVQRLIEFRSGQSWFGRAVSVVSGKDAKRADHIDRGLVRNQRVLETRLDELRQRGAVLDADVARIVGHLRRTQFMLDDALRAGRATAAQLTDLADVTVSLADLVDGCEQRLEHLGRRLDLHAAVLGVLECHRLSTHALDVAVSRWSDGETYSQFPLTCQLVFLAVEVATGPCGWYELLCEAQDGPAASRDAPARYFRNRLAKQIKADSPVRLWTASRPVADVLLEAVDGVSRSDADMAAEILGARLHPALATRHGGFVTALAVVLDLAAQRAVTENDVVDALAGAQLANGPTRLTFDGAALVDEVVAAVTRAELRERRKLATERPMRTSR